MQGERRIYMQYKVLEIRDSCTFISVIAIKMEPKDEIENFYLRREGFIKPHHVILVRIGNQMSQADPYAWGNRTMTTAHLYILEHFDELKSGDVVDVEFILGETKSPKISERLAGCCL